MSKAILVIDLPDVYNPKDVFVRYDACIDNERCHVTDKVISKGIVECLYTTNKLATEDYILYNREWLHEHLGEEFELQASVRNTHREKSLVQEAVDSLRSVIDAIYEGIE